MSCWGCGRTEHPEWCPAVSGVLPDVVDEARASSYKLYGRKRALRRLIAEQAHDIARGNYQPPQWVGALKGIQSPVLSYSSDFRGSDDDDATWLEIYENEGLIVGKVA